MSEDCPARIDIFTAAEPVVTRILPKLAAEIGLNESIVLLQIAFWIKNAQNCIKGEWWTFQSVRDMQEKAFEYMGLATINRTIKNLEAKQLIATGNFNKRKGDKTRWFALNPEGLSKLKSIKVVSIDDAGTVSEWNTPFQNGTPLFQDGTPSDQNGTTLPEIPPETPTIVKDKETAAKKSPRPRKAKPYDDVPGETRKAILTAWLNSLPEKPTTNEYVKDTNQNLAAGIARAGYCAADVERYVKAQYQDKFWQGKFLSLQNIATNLGIWIKGHPIAGVIKTPTPSSGQPPPAPGTLPETALDRARRSQRELYEARKARELAKASGE